MPPRRVTGLTPRGPPEAVFNLEVHGEHVYRVGAGGVLVHNGNICPPVDGIWYHGTTTSQSITSAGGDLKKLLGHADRDPQGIFLTPSFTDAEDYIRLRSDIRVEPGVVLEVPHEAIQDFLDGIPGGIASEAITPRHLIPRLGPGVFTLR